MTSSPTASPAPVVSSRSRLVLAAYLSLCLIWGSTWLGIRFLVADVPVLEGAALRFMIGGLILLGLALARRRPWPRDGRAWNAIGVLSLTMMAVPYGLLFWAEQHVTSSMTAVLFSALPLLVALLTPVMTHNKVPREAVFAMTIAFAGLLMLFYRNLSSGLALWGGAAVLVAMALSAWSVVYAKKRLLEVDAVVSTAMQFLLASVALWWGDWVLEARRHAHWTKSAIGALAFLTIVGSCVAFVVYYWLLKRMQAYQLSTINLVIPIIAVLEGAWLGRESIPLLMLAVMVVVLLSVGAVLRADAAAFRHDQADLLMLRSKTP